MLFETMHPSWQSAMPSAEGILVSIEGALQNEALPYQPREHAIMAAFKLPLTEVRVLIVGQDPYPTAGAAVGRAFAIPSNFRPFPASLRNIFTELQNDLGLEPPDASLSGWTNQGVLLLNRHLTTRIGEPASHRKIGWAHFTDLAVETLVQSAVNSKQPLISILWGNKAQQLASRLSGFPVITSAHPSPLSARRGFFGSKPFSKANAALIAAGESAIDWSC